ncbi:MAG: alpha/beta fold hydrolase [Bacteroidetes bacterium]|jgi:pimeloyl-ACP methyl ester carboxylesterase|nr:alpha/beta fold hydrolase [Bacteroidota bacterium]
MPYHTVNGATLYVEERGAGPESVVFAHGLLWSGRMFEAQVRALQDRYRCITFDFRGQGRSAVTPEGYDMETLTADAVALIRRLDAAPCHVVGLSMGGFVGMRLAVRHPDLVASLTLMNTSADPEPAENVPRYRLLNRIARWFGLRAVADRVLPIMFGETFLNDPTRAEERAGWRTELLANDRLGISRAVRGVIERDGVADELDQIAVPTLILAGDEDVATVPAKAERLHALIADSQRVVIPGAGHSSVIEQPDAVNAALAPFLASVSTK